ncbi:MAG: TRAP transporter small permease subunit [Desulfobacula sp.]|jgi:TRAP-type C4-dicarboxylate transport system permease small subunit|nr:TRAP transporter small permease subunit [Desulfobacula sp.]
MANTGKKEIMIAIVGNSMDKLKSASNFFLFVLMVGLILILGVNIVLRYLFDNPIAWSNTASRYAYIFIVLVGSGVSYIEGGHAQIDFIYDRAHTRLKFIFDLFHCIIMIGVSLVLIVMGLKHSISMWPVHTPIIPWFSVGIVYLSIPLCALLILLCLIKKALEL